MQKKKGISLIVLVITIIVMIILAAAIILSLNNAGIIGNANKAVDESNMDTIKAEADLKYAEYILNKSVIGANPTVEAWLNQEIKHKGYVIKVINGETVVLKDDSLANAYLEGIIKKGDYVTYKAGNNVETVNQYVLEGTTVKSSTTNITVSDSLNWRVLGIDNNGELLLTLDNTTSEKISLAGKEGYFNGEKILHDACSVFGKGEHATGARSITREDIDKVTNVDYSDVRSMQGFYLAHEVFVKYGIKITTGSQQDSNIGLVITDDFNLTKTLYHFGDSINEEINNDKCTFINSYVSYDVTAQMKNLTTSDNAYKMLFINSQTGRKLEYFMANKMQGIGVDSMAGEDYISIDYHMGCVQEAANSIGGKWLFSGYNTSYENMQTSTYLKPVVSINKNTGFSEATTKIKDVATWDLI